MPKKTKKKTSKYILQNVSKKILRALKTSKKIGALLFIVGIAVLGFYLYPVFVKHRPALFFPKWKDYQVYGLDISKYQDEINWSAIEEQHFQFVFVKATEGERLVDKRFKENWKALDKTQIPHGAYHFYRPDVPWKIQAQNFVHQVRLKKGDFPPVLDIEKLDGNNPALVRRDIKKWLELVGRFYGCKPIIYTYESFYNDYLQDEFKNYPLWIASYSNWKPELKDSAQWIFWQYADNGQVDGIEESVDLNAFYGNEKELKKILIK